MNFNQIGILDILLILNSLIILTVIILEKRQPEKTIAWILIFLIVPPLGIIFYLVFGKSWAKKSTPKGFATYNRETLDKLIGENKDEDVITLIKLISRNSNSPLFINNHIEIFRDGNEKFPVLLEEMKNAVHNIHLEYYIVKDDHIGRQIKDVLIAKAKEGVKVRFLIDKVGSLKASRKYFKEMKEAGVSIVSYPPPESIFFNIINIKLNFRNHRKIAVIDDTIGFIGGINIGDEYLGKGKMGYWRDTHIMVKGDFAFGLQAVFFNDFLALKRRRTRSILFNEALKKFHSLQDSPEGSIMQFIISGPDSEYPAFMQSILKMISMADKQIFISSPYFIPNDSIMDALKSAALAGLDVRILFPGKPDHYIVYKASLTYLRELSKYGVKVYFYDKNAFIHSKTLTIDGKIGTVGSANMDNRSFYLNFELNAVIYDEKVIEKLDDMFYDDLKVSTRVTSEYFDNLSHVEKSIQAVSRIFSALL